MSSFVKKKIKCMCCGKIYKADMLKGYSVFGNDEVDLDTNPHNPALYNRVLLCPHCGYATAEPYTMISREVKLLIKEDNYKEILKSKQYDDVCKKLLLAGFLAVKIKNVKEAAYNYLLSYWYMKEHDISGYEKARRKSIKNFERYLIKNPDFEMAMILIDLLRQEGLFDEATETLLSLDGYITDNDILKKISKYEKELISRRDSESHKLEEVTV